MNIIYLVFACAFLFVLSSGLNIYLLYKLKESKKKRPESLELQEFMQDLMSNKSAMLRVHRVDQSNLFLRSPRDS